MITTTYVRLEQAATMLNTDADTLLIAAAEGRLNAHWLFNSPVGAEFGCYEELDGDEMPPTWVPVDRSIRHFLFVVLHSSDAANLLKRPEIKVSPWQLTRPDSAGNYWVREEFSNLEIASENFIVTRNDVFFERLDIERIRDIGTPEFGHVPALSARKSTPRDNSLLATIAAILAAWPGGTMPSGKDLEKAAQSVGLTISDDTIRKVLSMAKEAAPSLPLTK